ncbi:MAG: hypothetical protein MUO77_06225 [Anaerolineales bacterium]|nr:hypothetical protein [Anaerolineales bacterium]
MKKISRSFSYTLFFIGALLGLTLTALAAWADLEAAAYGFDRTGGGQLSSLSCPILMTANETSSFSVKVTNTTQRKLSPSIETDVTARLMLPITSYTPTELVPGESKRVEWKIGPENIEFRQFVFIRARVYAFYPLPNRENTCGVFIVNLPSNGTVITWTMVVLSLLGTGLGLYGLTQSQGPVDMLRFKLLFILVIAGLITSFMGWWMQGVIVIAVSLLLGIVTAGFTIRKQ